MKIDAMKLLVDVATAVRDAEIASAQDYGRPKGEGKKQVVVEKLTVMGWLDILKDPAVISLVIDIVVDIVNLFTKFSFPAVFGLITKIGALAKILAP